MPPRELYLPKKKSYQITREKQLKKTIKRGDVYWINFDLPFGTRPGLIIQNDIGNRYASSVIVAIITSTVLGRSYPVDVLLPDGLLPNKNSRVLAGTIQTVSKARVGDHITTLPEDIMSQMDSALITSLDLEKHTRS